jgi:hypothetical protein
MHILGKRSREKGEQPWDLDQPKVSPLAHFAPIRPLMRQRPLLAPLQAFKLALRSLESTRDGSVPLRTEWASSGVEALGYARKCLVNPSGKLW